MILEKLRLEAGLTIEINEDNKLSISTIEKDTSLLSKKDLSQLIFELNELAIKMK